VLVNVVSDLDIAVALSDKEDAHPHQQEHHANIVKSSHRATSDHEKRRTGRALFWGLKAKSPASAGPWDGGRTRARTWDPLIKRHTAGIDFSRKIFQLDPNPSIRDQ
jgi:hypothetical protein